MISCLCFFSMGHIVLGDKNITIKHYFVEKEYSRKGYDGIVEYINKFNSFGYLVSRDTLFGCFDDFFRVPVEFSLTVVADNIDIVDLGGGYYSYSFDLVITLTIIKKESICCSDLQILDDYYLNNKGYVGLSCPECFKPEWKIV